MDLQSVGAGTTQDGPIDVAERERLLKLANEASERLSFHRTEVERWKRTGRAAMAAVTQFDSASPVQGASIDEFVKVGEQSEDPEVRY